MADIQSMESISKDMDELFFELQEKYSIGEYIEISTCNRKEYYISNDFIAEDDELLSHENQIRRLRITIAENPSMLFLQKQSMSARLSETKPISIRDQFQ